MKLFASDYDGTFLKHNYTQHELNENIKQVEKWREDGNLFVFATGRDIPEMTNYMPDGLTYDYLVCINGGIILDKNGAIILEEVIPQQVASEILGILKEHHITNHYVSNTSKIGPGKITFSMDTPEAALNIANSLANQFEGKAAFFSNECCVDIISYGVSKATGVGMIAKRHSIIDDNIFCMGDSYNDLPMLNAYNGITLPGVNAAVSAAAIMVYDSVGEALKKIR